MPMACEPLAQAPDMVKLIPFKWKITESNGQYLELRTEQAEIRTAEIRRTAPEKLLPAGTNID